MPSLVHAKNPKKHSYSRSCMACGGECRMKDGGEVKEHTFHSPAGGSANRAKGAARVRNEEHQKGVNKSTSVYSPGESKAGVTVRDNPGHTWANQEHRRVLNESRSMPNPKLKGLAEGGEVDMDQDPDKAKSFVSGLKGALGHAEGGEIHDEPDLDDMAADELMDAIHSKDKSKMVSAMKALISSCMNDED